jgi:predicted ATP-dependent serine protease
MSDRKLSYDWVCHACTEENSKQVQQCRVCGCEAFASVQTMQKHASPQRKAELQRSREFAVQVMYWLVGGVIALLFKIALLAWM